MPSIEFTHEDVNESRESIEELLTYVNEAQAIVDSGNLIDLEDAVDLIKSFLPVLKGFLDAAAMYADVLQINDPEATTE